MNIYEVLFLGHLIKRYCFMSRFYSFNNPSFLLSAKSRNFIAMHNLSTLKLRVSLVPFNMFEPSSEFY